MKVKKMLTVVMSGLLITGVMLPTVGLATDDGVYIVNTEQAEVKGGKNAIVPNRDIYRSKTVSERNQLPADEKALVDALENYITSQVNPNSRTFSDKLLNKLFVDFAFDFGFNRDNKIFAALASGSGETAELFKPYKEWFDQLPNKELKTMTVFDKPTKRNVKVNAFYVENNSDTTVVLHHGYRGDYQSMLPQVKFFSELGYNIILVEARSHGISEGKYITFGMNESQDLNTWVSKEVAAKPQQKIYLYGVSMGAATVMLSQEKRQPNVKAVIEDCGYSSVEQQFRDMLRMISKATQYIPLLNQINWYAKEDTLLNLLNDQHLKPQLEMDLFNVSPLASTKKSGIPALYIHGEADTFIPPVAKDLLYTAAIGYKEELGIAGAEHGASFFVDNPRYEAKVISFMNAVENLTTNGPEVASDVNLLENVEFNQGSRGFDGWLTSLNSQPLANTYLSVNRYGEQVLESKWRNDYATFVKRGEGVRFYNRAGGSRSHLGQNVPVVAGQTYEFSVAAQNTTPHLLGYPSVTVSAGNTLKQVPLKNRGTVKPIVSYQATTSQPVSFKVGTQVGSASWLDLITTYTQLTEFKVVNADRQPPEPLTNIETSQTGNQVLITGHGEPNTTVLLLDGQTVLVKATTDSRGNFQLRVSGQKGQYHLVNEDVKGNRSQSSLIVIQ